VKGWITSAWSNNSRKRATADGRSGASIARF
jgi:hypothetical protein